MWRYSRSCSSLRPSEPGVRENEWYPSILLPFCDLLLSSLQSSFRRLPHSSFRMLVKVSRTATACLLRGPILGEKTAPIYPRLPTPLRRRPTRSILPGPKGLRGADAITDLHTPNHHQSCMSRHWCTRLFVLAIRGGK